MQNRRSIVNPAAALALASIAAAGCGQSLKLTKDDSPVVLAHQVLAASNPARRGPYSVRRLFYGSGTDKQRSEFRDSVTIRTKPVDASPFVSMDPPVAKSREKYWGFGAKAFPINGRVWFPEGDGRFPLVLVVHGNHDMTDFSDPGYEYLGQLLASRGFILVSVDQNFINGSLRGENDGRGWLLLKHIERWKAWNDSAGSPFRGKVDLSNIALIGHSRGGEAVAHAAAFNRMSRYPDDANVKFDFGFDIRSLVAIAPVDGQYRPAAVLQPLENVNYLVVHGSHDGDVTSFGGLRQFQRLRFTDESRQYLKSAWYVYRANHGQWNTVWGNKDNGPRSGRWLDLRGLLAPEAQREFGEVVIGAFLEATLKGRSEYLPLFRDHRVAGGWLPKTMYVTRFQESGFRPLATFDEDVDVTTGAPGVTITGDSLGTWKEALLTLRNANDPLNTNGVTLGWNNRIAGPDTTKRGRPASYTLTLSDSLVRALGTGGSSAIYLSLAPTDAKPGPRSTPRDTTRKADSTSPRPATPPKPKGPAPRDTTPIDFTVEVVDANGVTARLPITRYGTPRRPLEVKILRRADIERQRYPTQYELVLQTYVLPLADFASAAPGLATNRIRTVRLVFDRADAGTIVLDDVGISRALPAAYTSVAVPAGR